MKNIGFIMLKTLLSLFALSILAACYTDTKSDVKSGDLSWAEAVELINSGSVVLAAQSHDRTVRLTLQDGTTFSTVEPKIDDIFDVVKQCGAPCSRIGLVTE